MRMFMALRRFPGTDRMLALGHHEVMPLMLRPLDHDAHKAERLEFHHSCRSSLITTSFTPFGRVSVVAFQPVVLSSWACAGRYHSLYGLGRFR